MSIHTHLPIYKAAYDLLDVVTDLAKNMNRDFKRSIGEKISTECIEITILVFRANVAQVKEPHLIELVERLQVIELMLRLAMDKRLISKGSYARAVEHSTSIGKQANGWRRAADIAAILNIGVHSVYQKAKTLGLKKSAEFLDSPLSGRTDGTRGAATRYQPGFTSWNKGKAIGSQGNSVKTQFKKGATPANVLPVGHIRINTEGYKDIKIAPGPGNWVQLHHYNWKQVHGEYPPKGMALIFKDGDKLNCEIENLELVSRKDLMLRNNVHQYGPEIAQLVQLRGAITRQINRKEKNQ